MEQLGRPLFRLRLESGPAMRPAARFAPGVQVASPPVSIAITIAGRTASAPDEGEVGCVPSALALMRTVFENHHPDPDHQVCLFFNGCTIGTCSAQYDFSVIHQGDAVLLSGFTFPPFQELTPVRVPLELYTREVVAFARAALRMPAPSRMIAWAAALHGQQREQLAALLPLAEAFLAGGCRDTPAYREAFMVQHGRLKRPLELQLVDLHAAGEQGDWEVEARILFGPISVHELIPMRVNGGDVVLVRALEFGSRGVRLAVMGVGAGGLGVGDRLTGLQLFYP